VAPNPRHDGEVSTTAMLAPPGTPAASTVRLRTDGPDQIQSGQITALLVSFGVFCEKAHVFLQM